MGIVVVEPSSSGVALIEAGIRMGKSVHIFSADHDDRQVSERIRSLATSVVRVDTNDAEAVFEAARKLACSDPVDALIPGFEYMVDIVAAAAARLGLPGLSLEAARCTRNKLAIREAMRRQGLAGPAYFALDTRADVERAAMHVGFPAVLKPVDACGSLMVMRVDSLADLRDAFGTASEGMLDMGRPVGAHMILESYIPGREFSVEGVVCAGQARVVAVTEKILGPEPYFVEMGHVVEAGIDASERAALVSCVIDTVRAVGLTLGVFHAEVRLGPSGPVLMEIAARLGGDRIYRLVELTKSVSLPELMVRSYSGETIATQFDAASVGVAGVRFLTFDEAICFSAVEGLDEVRRMTGCQEAEIYYGAGQPIPAAADFRGRVGHVLFTAPTRSILDERLKNIDKVLHFLPLAA